MSLILDTHVLIWTLAGDRRLSQAAADAIASGEALFVSAAAAWELADLSHRGRIPQGTNFDAVREALDLAILDVPADLWRRAVDLPNLHGDPVDRMLIAHALHADLTLITADRTMRRYPVRTLW